MRKILLYTDTNLIGGAELQIFLLAKFLDKTKFQPILACGAYTSLDNWCEKFHREEIPVIRFQVRHKNQLNHYFQIKKILHENDIDIIHIHVWNPAAARQALLAAKHTHTKTITTEHDPFPLGTIKTIIKKTLTKSVSTIVAVSDNNKTLLKKLSPKDSKKIITIKNGLDLDWWRSQIFAFTHEDLKETKEKTFRAKEDTLIITTIAALHHRKGLDTLLNAFAKIPEKYPNTKLIIIGDGPEKANLQAQINNLNLQNHALLLGKQGSIPKLLKSSDIFALPSRREAFGFVLLEAMICGLPIIASATGGIPEIITPHENGLLQAPEDQTTLTKNLITLIKNSDLRTSLAKKGQETVINNFSALKMAKEYEKAYTKLLS